MSPTGGTAAPVRLSHCCLAAAAGALACLAGVFGKLAASSLVHTHSLALTRTVSAACYGVQILANFGMMAVLTSLTSLSSFLATVCSTSANLLLTVLSHFHPQHHFIWATGAFRARTLSRAARGSVAAGHGYLAAGPCLSCQVWTAARPAHRPHRGCRPPQEPVAAPSLCAASPGSCQTPDTASATGTAEHKAEAGVLSASPFAGACNGDSNGGNTVCTEKAGGGTAPTSGRGGTGIYNYKAVVAYEGRAYQGFQIQPGRPSIQAKLESAIGAVFNQDRESLKLQAAGRTDSGVHALGQVISFYAHREAPHTERTLVQLNQCLPYDIRLLSLQRVPPDFSARYSCTGKEYHFLIHSAPIHDPFTVWQRQHEWRPLDVDAMRRTAQNFVGTHDFTQFANASDNTTRNPVRTLHRCDIVHTEYGMRLELEGEGFLYRQVRHIAGALIAVGLGKLSIETVQQILDMGSSVGAGALGRKWVPGNAHGLYLVRVAYPEFDSVTEYMYPDMYHDEFGRPFLPTSEFNAAVAEVP